MMILFLFVFCFGASFNPMLGSNQVVNQNFNQIGNTSSNQTINQSYGNNNQNFYTAGNQNEQSGYNNQPAQEELNNYVMDTVPNIMNC